MIKAKNNNKTNVYVQEYRLNGESLQEPFIPFKNVVEGGVLELDMAETAKDQY